MLAVLTGISADSAVPIPRNCRNARYLAGFSAFSAISAVLSRGNRGICGSSRDSDFLEYLEEKKDSLDPGLFLLLQSCRVLLQKQAETLPPQPSPLQMQAAIEEDRRQHSIVVESLVESTHARPQSRREEDLRRITEILDFSQVEAAPIACYRMGKVRESRGGSPPQPRPIKVLLPAKVHVHACLAASRTIRSHPSFFGSPSTSQVYLRPSLTKEMREKEFQLREERRRLLREGKKMAVFDGELVPVEELPRLKAEKKERNRKEYEEKKRFAPTPLLTGGNSTPLHPNH